MKGYKVLHKRLMGFKVVEQDLKRSGCMYDFTGSFFFYPTYMEEVGGGWFKIRASDHYNTTGYKDELGIPSIIMVRLQLKMYSVYESNKTKKLRATIVKRKKPK